MIITELLEMGEFFPEYPACPAFQSLGDKTERILRRVFKKDVDMVWIYLIADSVNLWFLIKTVNNCI